MEKRTGRGIWQGLYQFPLIESKGTLSARRLRQTQEYLGQTESFDVTSVVRFNETPVLHKLSHQHLSIQFWIVEVTNGDERFIEIEEVHRKPVPIVLANFISEFPAFQL